MLRVLVCSNAVCLCVHMQLYVCACVCMLLINDMISIVFKWVLDDSGGDDVMHCMRLAYSLLQPNVVHTRVSVPFQHLHS